MSKAGSDLDKYLQSHGTRLERYLSPYQEDGEKSHLCIFCDDPHDGFGVYLLSQEMNKSSHTHTFACSSCQSEVEEMMETVYFYSYREVKAETFKDYAARTIPFDAAFLEEQDRPSMSGDPNTKIGFDKEEKLLNTQRRKVLHDLNTYYKFPADVHRFYLHLKERIDEYAVPDSCCVCHSNIREQIKNGAAMILSVPVYKNDVQMTGGDVAVCKDCRKYLEDIDDTVDKMIENQVLVMEYCSRNTEKVYLIEHGEYMARLDYNVPKGDVRPEYLCPEEAYIATVDSHWRQLFQLMDNEWPRIHPPDRYVSVKGLCDCHFYVDLTMNPEYVATFHRAINNGSEYAICESCRRFRSKLEYKFNQIIELDGGGALVLEPDEANWSGTINKLDSGVYQELYDITESKNIENFIAKAINAYVGKDSNSGE